MESIIGAATQLYYSATASNENDIQVQQPSDDDLVNKGDKIIQSWPEISTPVWLLGKAYSALHDVPDLNSDALSRLWFTYRKNFDEIGESGYTTDTGWGCMLRCGQMVLAEALLRIELGRDWRWDNLTITPQEESKYMNIISLFYDRKVSPYSIHQISLMGESIQTQKPVGTWFGPNTVAQVLRKLSVFEKSVPIGVHVALDNTLIIDEIKSSALHEDNIWKPLLLFIPLRLGLTEINSIYISDLMECFEMKQSVGIIGGKPNHALYFIGYLMNELVFMDPHLSTQPSQRVSSFRDQTDCTYHTKNVSRMDFSELDPSLALCFLCKTEEEFDCLCETLLHRLIRGHSSPLFEICRSRPDHMSPLEDDGLPSTVPDENTGHDYEQNFEGLEEEEFEVL